MLSATLNGQSVLGWPDFVDNAIDTVADGAKAVASGARQVVAVAGRVIDQSCGILNSDIGKMALNYGGSAAGVGPLSPQAQTACSAAKTATAVAQAGLRQLPGGAPKPATTVRPTGTSAQRLSITVTPKKGTFTPPSTRYKGGIAWRSSKTGKFVIAMPRGLADFGAPQFQVVAQEASNPEGATIVSEPEGKAATGESTPFYKNPLVIGGAVLAVAAGGYFLMRRR